MAAGNTKECFKWQLDITMDSLGLPRNHMLRAYVKSIFELPMWKIRKLVAARMKTP
jgi:hypothetical protein